MATDTLQQQVEAIYADGKVSPVEMVKLTKAVDEAEAQVVASTGVHGLVATLFKSFDVTRQLLQESVLDVRKDEKGKYSTDPQA